MSMWSKKVKEDENEDEDNSDLIEKANKILDAINVQIGELKAEILHRDRFMERLVMELINKPSAAAIYAASKAATVTANSGTKPDAEKSVKEINKEKKTGLAAI